MSDLFQKAVGKRNWVETIADRLPGFSGYQNRETRREVDRLWRGYVAKRIDQIRLALQDHIRDFGADLDRLRGWDGVEKSLDGLANRVRTADYGYSGFFDAMKIGESELEAIYRFDCAFDDEVSKLASLIGGLGQDAGAARRAVEDANARWQERAGLVDGLAGGGK